MATPNPNPKKKRREGSSGKKKPRTCGWCREPGHDRRNCPRKAAGLPQVSNSNRQRNRRGVARNLGSALRQAAPNRPKTALVDGFVFMDLESDGGDWRKDPIVQLSAVFVWNGVGPSPGGGWHTFNRYVNLGDRKLNPFAQGVHNINPQVLRDKGVEITTLLCDFSLWVQECVELFAYDGRRSRNICLVAHNGFALDFRMLIQESIRHNIPLNKNIVCFLDTLSALKSRAAKCNWVQSHADRSGEGKRIIITDAFKMTDLVNDVLSDNDIKSLPERAHDARYDTEAMRLVFDEVVRQKGPAFWLEHIIDKAQMRKRFKPAPVDVNNDDEDEDDQVHQIQQWKESLCSVLNMADWEDALLYPADMQEDDHQDPAEEKKRGPHQDPAQPPLSQDYNDNWEYKRVSGRMPTFKGPPMGLKWPDHLERKTREAEKKYFGTPAKTLDTMFGPIEQKIRRHTNEWGKQHIEDWEKDMDKEEHLRFIAALVPVGFGGARTRIRDMFSNCVLFYNHAVASLFTRKRFEQILRAWRPCGEDVPGLEKIEQLYEMCNEVFTAYWNPDQSISGDEVTVLLMAKCAGKISAKHKTKGKWCHMLYSTACAITGYLLYLKLRRKGLYPDRPSNTSQNEAFLLDAMKPFENKNYVVYCDRLYTSIALFRHLKRRGIHATGTMMRNRKGQPFATKLIATGNKKTTKIGQQTYKVTVMKQNDLHCWVHADGMRLAYWWDNNLFALASTFGDTKNGLARKRRRGVVRVPHVAYDYNKRMGGVDVADANWQRYHVGFKKMRRWYMNHLFFIVDAFIENARIIHSSAIDEKVSSRQFRVELYKSWSGLDLKAAENDIRIQRGLVNPSTVDHNLMKTTQFVTCKPAKQTSAQRRRKRLMCLQCAAEKKRTDTIWRCSACKPEVALCSGRCHEKWHKNLLNNKRRRKRRR